MPLGFERINARVKQPNDRINFIKALEGPDKIKSQDFLERIAAIVNPIMKNHHIAVMSLEEYEPNPEFLGRNFNAGEVIQLVLKTRSGHWMPFKFVQMVMIHELSHCKQMNHSKAFWNVRNEYASELEILWTQGYTGEGLWSRGIKLVDGLFADNSLAIDEPVPQHLCGGTYQSKGRRKRKAKEKISYKERQARRIARKFGTNGQALGADEETKVKLENGKKSTAKPRVAGSARGRELRAAAALARFEVRKDEPIMEDQDDENGSSTESEDDYNVAIKTERNEAVDIDGTKMVDSEGKGLFKVCEDEDKNNVDAQNEMAQLRGVNITGKQQRLAVKSIPMAGVRQKNQQKEGLVTQMKISFNGEASTTSQTAKALEKLGEGELGNARVAGIATASVPAAPSRCPICSMDNIHASPTCAVCANVLDVGKVRGVWHCRSEVCRDGKYINSEDCGFCGVCGARKCS